jgi:hypothetical protein
MRSLSRWSGTLFALASCVALASLSAQPRRPLFEIEPVFAVQVTTSAPPPNAVLVVDPTWDAGIARFGVRLAVRPFRRLSRVHAEAVLAGAPQSGGDAVLRLRPPIAGDARVTSTTSDVRVGDGRGPLTSVRIGYTLLERSTSELSVLAGAASMVDLERPMAVFGATAAFGPRSAAVRMTGGIEWMGTRVDARTVTTQYSRGTIVSNSVRPTRATVSVVLLRAGVQWRPAR